MSLINYKFANFFDTEILEGISAGATSIKVTPTDALVLPPVGAGEQIQLTLWDGKHDPEIVGVTENLQTGTMTVIRAQEDTTAFAWPAGTQVACTLTAEVINSALEAYFDIGIVLDENFLPLSGGTLTGPLLLPPIDPVSPNEATRRAYVDAILGNKLPLTGGTMSGDINMNENHIFGLPTPTADGEPATKGYVDSQVTEGSSELIDRMDDENGHLTSAGTDVAYTVIPNQSVGVNEDGFRISFRPHVTNGVDPTLQVGTAPAVPINGKPGVKIGEGALLANFPYSFVYSSAQVAWLIDGSYDVVALSKITTKELTTVEKLTSSGLVDFSPVTSHMFLPRGTTAQRWVGSVEVPLLGGELRENSTLKRLERYDLEHATWLPQGSVLARVSGFISTPDGANPDTHIVLSWQEALLTDAEGNAVRHGPGTTTINSSNSAVVDGLDTGARAANTDYYVWLISNGTLIKGILHASNVSPPITPTGYTFMVPVGWQRTDATNKFFRIKQLGRKAQYIVGTNPSTVRTFAVGAQTSSYGTVTISMVDRSLAGLCPPRTVAVDVFASGRAGGGGTQGVVVAPNTSWGGTNRGPEGPSQQIFPISIYAATASAGFATIVLEAHSLAWAADNNASAVGAILGWEDNVPC